MRAEIYWVPELDGVRLAVMPRPRGDYWLRDEIRSFRQNGVDRIVSLLEPREANELGLAEEAGLCEENGLSFTSFPIPDRGVPDSLLEVARLVRSIESDLLRGEAVAIHCRAGIGRSGLIAGCVLVNLGVPEAEVFTRISRGRGIKVPDTAIQVEWLARYAQNGKDAL
ncbi:MAG: dual specificity protein phosphatase family protein [Burkholderiales bacterium]|nr:dual specificity protein phosphatase family protein [Burkholderiales bacterium]